MKHIEEKNRNQIQLTSLDMMVDQHSAVRALDLFVQWALDHQLGFQQTKQITGRPSYPLKTLVSIYIYGYLNKIRSSRDLEKACKVNIELMWLIKGHRPCYKTIANFRKDNRQAFKNLFKLYREFCIKLNLYGKQVVAIDGSKFRAQNSMKNNFNKKKVDRHLEYIKTKQHEYLNSLDQADKEKAMANPECHDRLAQLDERKLKYNQLKKQLEQSEETQISTTDPDARALPLHMRIVEVSYNLQSAVDDKHNLIVDYQITNKNDSRALSDMAIRSKQALHLGPNQELTILADKGYHTGAELQRCHDEKIQTVVAIPRKSKRADITKPAHLQKDKFHYNPNDDSYSCPAGKVLLKQATYKRKDRKGNLSMSFDRYTIKHSICELCQYHKACVSAGKRKASQGRCIDRYHTDAAVQRNKDHVYQNKALYKRRQAIVEHPFGTIKRAWGYTHTLMKTIPKVEAEFSIIMLCYNLRRTMSILGLNGFKSALQRAIYYLSTPRSSIEQLRSNFLSLFYAAA